MIKAEVLKDLQKYILDFPEVDNLEDAYDLAQDVASGQAVHITPTEMLDLGPSEGYSHIKVYWQVDPDPNEILSEEATAALETPENPRINGSHVETLGQKVVLDVAEYIDEKHIYVMPYLLNSEPALHMIGQTGLEAICQQYVQKQKYLNAVIVLPHGPIIDEAEALAFVQDFAAEDAAAQEQLLKETDKTARGFDWPDEK